MKIPITMLSWLSLLVAVAAWTGVVMFAFSIDGMAQSALVQSTTLQTINDQQTTATNMHVLARTIAPETSQLETLLQTDPLSLASVITQAGTDAGVSLAVNNASPESPPASSGTPPSVAQTTAISFAVQGTGTFEALMRAALLLESLPVASSIQSLDLGPASVPASPHAPWVMDVQLQILTDSQISS